MLSRVDVASAFKAGVVGTAIMTIVMYSLPVIGLPRMDIMAALGSVFPFKISPYVAGFLVHFGIGIAMALGYALFFFGWIPGPNWLKGVVFSLLPWLFAITLLVPSLRRRKRRKRRIFLRLIGRGRFLFRVWLRHLTVKKKLRCDRRPAEFVTRRNPRSGTSFVIFEEVIPLS